MKKREQTTQCGLCGRRGHNRRTCGKTPTPKFPLKTQPAKTIPEPKTTAKVVNNAFSQLHNNHTPDTTHHGGQKVVENDSSSSGYTAEDLETLWCLKDGNFGKERPGKSRRKIWSEESAHALNEMVETLEKGESGIEVKEWVKFFKNFGAEAKATLLMKTAKAPYIKAPIHMDIVDIADETLHPHTKNSNPHPLHHVLHIKIFEALSKDASSTVRSNLASKEGLPDHVKNILLNDPHTSVVLKLAERADTTPEQLTYLKNRIDKRIGFAKNGFITWDAEETYKKIATHPNTPTEVVKSFFTNPPLPPTSDASPFIRVFAAGNKNAPTEIVESSCQQILHKRTAQKLGNLHDNQWDAAFLGNASKYHVKREQINDFLSPYFQNTFPPEPIHYHHERSVTLALMSDKLTSEDLEKYYHAMDHNYIQQGGTAALALFINPNLPTSVAEHFLRNVTQQNLPKSTKSIRKLKMEMLAKRLTSPHRNP